MSVSRRAGPPQVGQVVVNEALQAFEGRALLARELDVERQLDGQVGVGDADEAAAVAIDDGNGGAPVALAGDAPVAEPEDRAPAAEALVLGELPHLVHGLVRGEAVEGAGVDQDAGVLGDLGGLGVETLAGLVGRGDDRPDGDAIGFGELEVAGVVGRNPHDRARAVVHQNVIGDPDGDALAGEGIDRLLAGVDAVLLGLADVPALAHFGDGPGDPGAELLLLRPGDEVGHDGVLGRDDEEGGAADRVDPGREDLDLLRGPVEAEADVGAGALADPVLLHLEDVLGPLPERGVAAEELVGVGGDLEEPLLHLLLRHRRVAAPAAAADDLLVGQDGLALRAPVDPALLAEGQAPLEHAQEDPLVPLVVVGQAGVDLAAPVVADAHALELGPHVGDVVEGPGLRVRAVLDGRVLGRHAEGVPADGMEDARAGHALLPGDDVADRIVADVAHVDAAGRVGVHFQAIELGTGRVLAGFEGPLVLPGLLPFGLDRGEVVGLGHGPKIL